MRIAYVSDSILPSRYANSIHVMKMCQAFARNGHETVLLARYGWGIGDLYKRYQVEPNFAINRNWRPKIFPKKIRIGIYTNILSWKVQRLMPQPDLLYGRDAHGLNVLRKLGIPYVYEAHKSPRNSSMQALQGELFRQPLFQRLVVISDALRNEYRDIYSNLPEEKILVAHDGADIFRKTTVSTIENNSNRIRVGYIGHLYPGKGMEVIAQLVPQLPDIEFHIIGGMKSDISFWQQKLGHFSNITFHGFVWQDQLASYFEMLDIVLAPYPDKDRYSKWTSPLKIFEYMSAGKAMIASDLEVLQEVLVHEKNALLANPGNVEQWVSAIRRLAEDNTLRARIARQANQDLVSKYTWQIRAERVLDGLEIIRKS